MARRIPQEPKHRDSAQKALQTRGGYSGKSLEIEIAKQLLADRIRRDIDWWYRQAQGLVENPQGKRDDNAARVVLKIFDKILPDKREITREEGGDSRPPVAIMIQGVNRGKVAAVKQGLRSVVEISDADSEDSAD